MCMLSVDCGYFSIALRKMVFSLDIGAAGFWSRSSYEQRAGFVWLEVYINDKPTSDFAFNDVLSGFRALIQADSVGNVL